MTSSKQVALGVFLVGGLLLFTVGLFWIGDRRQLFSESLELYTEFSNVSGLARGAKVRVSGMDAGEVLEVRVPPDPDSRFRVRFRVVSGFRPILRADSVASIQTDGLVGNKFLQVEAGTSQAAAVTEGFTVRSRETVEIADLMQQASETIGTANAMVVDIRSGINETVKAIADLNRETVEVINEVGDQVGRFSSAGNQVAEDVSSMVADIRKGQGTIGRLITEDGLYQEIQTAARETGEAVQNMKAVSADMKTISEEVKSRELGAKIEQVAGKIETLAQEATDAIRSFQKGGSGGLMAEIRQTLSSANQTMANLAENAEALKRNWFFRGFFNQRGFYDLDAVTVREYHEGKFLPDRLQVREWLEAAGLFGPRPEGEEQLTEEGKQMLDLAMARFLRYSRNDPLIIESWAGAGGEADQILRSRSRAIMVSEYLVEKFDLRSNYVGIMPMNAVASGGQARDGIALVLFAPKDSRR
ncbi:MAG: MCE family protein [Acidobacteria bacterium]|nr:MCE family protein [Acidobacteriota bacterium]